MTSLAEYEVASRQLEETHLTFDNRTTVSEQSSGSYVSLPSAQSGFEC